MSRFLIPVLLYLHRLRPRGRSKQLKLDFCPYRATPCTRTGTAGEPRTTCGARHTEEQEEEEEQEAEEEDSRGASLGCARIFARGCDEREKDRGEERESSEKKEGKAGGRNSSRGDQRRREDMSAVESALDVLSRAATMVQGQFTPFRIPVLRA